MATMNGSAAARAGACAGCDEQWMRRTADLVIALEEALRAARICAAQRPPAISVTVAITLARVRSHLERAEELASGGVHPCRGAMVSRLSPVLSEREVAVLRLVAAGKSNREMAAALCRSERTIERHIENIYRKIAAHNRADATAYALRHHLT